MYLMKLIIDVAKSKKRDLIALFINTLILVLFYYLLFEDSEVIYPLILSMFIIFIYFVIEIIKYISFQEKLIDSRNSPSYNKSNVNFIEENILDIIKEVHTEYISKIHTLNQQINDRETLFSQWIHNMKTSITVIDLACEKSNTYEENKYIKDINEENKLLKKNLEECLNVLRLDNFSRDYITTSCNLRELVKDSINEKKRDFIYKGVFPKVNIDDSIYIYTDTKWCRYMINQILSNAIKYSYDKDVKGIEISAINNYEETELIIKDYGIGISKEDLQRIFDPFFTGNNGRKMRQATGVGLYMVKLISNKLEHKVDITSKLNEGTIVKIKFRNNIIV